MLTFDENSNKGSFIKSQSHTSLAESQLTQTQQIEPQKARTHKQQAQAQVEQQARAQVWGSVTTFWDSDRERRGHIDGPSKSDECADGVREVVVSLQERERGRKSINEREAEGARLW